jgi:hypothetical protein
VGNEHEATANSRSGEGGEVACRRGDAPAQPWGLLVRE